MKKLTWWMWVAKFLLLAVAIVELIMLQFGVAIAYWVIIATAATWFAQFLLGLLPGEVWQRVIGKMLIMLVSVVGLILEQLGLEIAIWAILAPMIVSLAQYLIALVPAES